LLEEALIAIENSLPIVAEGDSPWRGGRAGLLGTRRGEEGVNPAGRNEF
jgi:hypothetical protein